MPRQLASPQQVTSKWVERLGASTTAIQQGVQRVQEAPGVAAARKFDKWQAGIQAAGQKWRERVAGVSLAEWQQSMLQVGIPRVAAGAQAKQHKFEKFMAAFLPYLQSGVEKVRSMPDTTYEQRKQRALAMMDHNHAYGSTSHSGGMG